MQILRPSTRGFVNLLPTNTTSSFHSTGQKCIPSHTLWRAFVGEVLFQAAVLIVERPFTLKAERIGVGQTGRHQLKNRWVDYPITSPFSSRPVNRCCEWHMSVRPYSEFGLRWTGMTDTSSWAQRQPLVHYLTLQSQELSYVLK